MTAKVSVTQNEVLAQQVIKEATLAGVVEYYLCPGARMAPLLELLKNQESLNVFYGFEERSTAFYAQGRARQTGRPVAVVTTSGTAVGELLPATMEAYYNGIPLLLITADRPRRFRGTAAPQSAEQVGIFNRYAPDAWDLADNETFSMEAWSCCTPAHINVCFEEPLEGNSKMHSQYTPQDIQQPLLTIPSADILDTFLSRVERPWVVVGGVDVCDREAVVDFLLKLQAPVYLEAPSGLREDPRLTSLVIRCIDDVWPWIDGVLRIGHVPTLRAWRDLEDKKGEIEVLSINHLPFSGLSWGPHVQVPLSPFLRNYDPRKAFHSFDWVARDKVRYRELLKLFDEEPASEPALFHALSQHIPNGSHIYLGNSSPIREWDLAATFDPRDFTINASRGLNGIDGQISQFLGLSSPDTDNWAVLGDLTTLYDMAGPWVLKDLPDLPVTMVTVNNGGGQIFSRMFSDKAFINSHQMTFEPLASQKSG